MIRRELEHRHDSDEPGSIEVEPFDGDAEYTLGQLMRATSELQQVIGELPSRRHPEGKGLRGELSIVRRLLGESPDDATGKKGSGIRGELATLVRSLRTLKLILAGLGAVAGAVELVLEVARLVHH
jgi:hypothetical protein